MKLADFLFAFLLSYMFGINKIAEILHKKKTHIFPKETGTFLALRKQKKRFIQILSLMALYDRANMNGTMLHGTFLWHFDYIPKKS